MCITLAVYIPINRQRFAYHLPKSVWDVLMLQAYSSAPFSQSQVSSPHAPTSLSTGALTSAADQGGTLLQWRLPTKPSVSHEGVIPTPPHLKNVSVTSFNQDAGGNMVRGDVGVRPGASHLHWNRKRQPSAGSDSGASIATTTTSHQSELGRKCIAVKRQKHHSKIH